MGEGENQIELAVCYTSSAQSFTVRNAEKNPVNVSVTQHKTFSIYWKTSEHLGQVQLAQITPHPSFIYIAISASRLILLFSSISSDRCSVQSDCLSRAILHTQNHNSNTTALRRPFATRNALVEEIPLSLTNSFSFKAFCSSNSYKGLQKKDYDNSSLQLLVKTATLPP